MWTERPHRMDYLNKNPGLAPIAIKYTTPLSVVPAMEEIQKAAIAILSHRPPVVGETHYSRGFLDWRRQ